MEEKDRNKVSLKIQEGVPQPPNINPDVLTGISRKRRKRYSVNEFTDGILSGNRSILSQAITLVESSLPEHFRSAQAIIEKCLPYSSRSVRVGITGVPGAGKSTFIETFGLLVAETGKKIAVLAIDPSSQNTKGSILGDKTRMEKLSVHPNAFVRPSPSAGTLGGVARKTRESIILCEAAGFDTIIVETVGVGQSETSVRAMVDFFLLLMLTGAGDEIQGIKRGIIEMADAVAITKADGGNKIPAENARIMFQNALSLFPRTQSGWKPLALTCSAREKTGISEILKVIGDYAGYAKKTGYFEELRKQQAVIRMHDIISEYLEDSFYNHSEIKSLVPELETELHKGTITSYKAALSLINKYFKK
ncbi:MAG TPA: methylmalonyl Co-A mutase-associated GTPase MeaB [Bacteroidales bacterium]|nr:methylmalonyl Co-A mutase-associated GTPase MeaB [Bacteroidales bacterium]HBZ19518.1 methylmalonyl Co-A mutase-associated GTPase MeaB [Bacteroidales bacterium]